MITPVLALLLATTAPSAQDSRIRELTYDTSTVFTITGRFRTATQIVFSPDETIRHAAIGDSVSWEIAVEGSVLFLKPRENHGETNLLVVTSRGGTLRHYAFALSARPAGDGAAWQVHFRYPDDELRARASLLAAEREGAERRLIGLELVNGAVEGPRNLDWSAQGDPALQPAEVSDNGRFTLLRFPAGQALPAILEVGDDGSERLVPHDVRGEWIVIHSVPRALRLRRGRIVLCLYNEAAPARPAMPATGTASPAVERTPSGARP